MATPEKSTHVYEMLEVLLRHQVVPVHVQELGEEERHLLRLQRAQSLRDFLFGAIPGAVAAVQAESVDPRGWKLISPVICDTNM